MTGRFNLVLHGHMPYVMHHGRWPHGEYWLYEAAAEVYLPLLQFLKESSAVRFTLGLTPVLLTQLREPEFVEGLYAYLQDRLEAAEKDMLNPDIAEQASFWLHFYRERLEQFRALEGDLVSAFVQHAQQGKIELLSSFATHGYAPLLKFDDTIREQLEVGLSISEHCLGFRPKGIWLPECAFRPQGLWSDQRLRVGIDRLLEEAGVTHFYVEHFAFRHARSEGLKLGGEFYKVDWDAVNQQPQWAWRSILEPHYVSTVGGDSSVVAFAREENLCAQLWSADHGYPGDPVYLEFHKKAPETALRYWRVTDRKLTLGAKKLYSPEIAKNRARLHAYHFANLVEQTLRHYSHSGRQGTLTCCFDAELFGHWWFEGIHFLQALFQELSRKEGVHVCTSTQVIKNSPPDKVVWIPECSWGEESDHRVWLNDKTYWIWNSIHIAEERYHTLQAKLKHHSMIKGDRLQTLVQQLRWNFLLLQASDWPFVIHNNSATDYGHQRFSVHLQRFERLLCAIEKCLLGVPLSEREELQVREAEIHEPLPKI